MGGADDGFAAAVETGVNQDRDAGAAVEFVYYVVIKRILAAVDGLNSGGAVNMGDGRNLAVISVSEDFAASFYLADGNHVGVGPSSVKPKIHFVPKDNRGKRTEGFAKFDRQVDPFLVFGIAGVG